ncbi:MAG TPA: hypothetical protein VK964_13535 [Nocardioidaceae bacterium]|nr:hypothetical protein [Nocardioidaceae bacterium]
MADSKSGAKRLYMHVGLPKSGTTFLQARMAANRDRLLREEGILYPSPEQVSVLHAALEVRGSHGTRGFSAEKVAGSWERLTTLVRAHDGTSVVSHEHFSGASVQQIAAARERLEGLEVHVVVTARDPVRQVPAMWQESIKNGATRNFERYGRQIMADLESGEHSRGFWSAQELTEVLRRWGTLAPPERMHLVTAPQAGGDPLELWRRFAGVVGFDPEKMDAEGERANESLGMAQVGLLRDVNATLDGRIRRPAYDRVAKRLFAQRILATQRSSPRAVLPADLFDPLHTLAERWVKEIEASGIQVHGDLADLLPRPLPEGAAHPDEVSDAERYAAAREAIADLLVEVERLQRRRPPAWRRAAPGSLRRVARRLRLSLARAR